MVGFHKQIRLTSPCFILIVLYVLSTILKNPGLAIINSDVKINENVSLEFQKLDYFRKLANFRLADKLLLILLIF